MKKRDLRVSLIEKIVRAPEILQKKLLHISTHKARQNER